MVNVVAGVVEPRVAAFVGCGIIQLTPDRLEGYVCHKNESRRRAGRAGGMKCVGERTTSYSAQSTRSRRNCRVVGAARV